MHRVGNVTQWFIRGKRSASLERSARKAIGTEILTGIYAMRVWRRTVCLRRYPLICSVQCWIIKRKIFQIFIVKKQSRSPHFSWASPDHPIGMTSISCEMIISERQTRLHRPIKKRVVLQVLFLLIIQHFNIRDAQNKSWCTILKMHCVKQNFLLIFTNNDSYLHFFSHHMIEEKSYVDILIMAR